MGLIQKLIWVVVPLINILICLEPMIAEGKNNDKEIVQAQVSLTVSESKRLIARAVSEMPIVKKAIKSGMVIITRGTTNTYVAEEILGKQIEKGALVAGRIYPIKGGKKLNPSILLSDIILQNGQVVNGLKLSDAVKKLKAGDVVIKGANALDYRNKVAGVYIGHPAGGTTGKFLPYVVARKAYLIIPIGLEKLVAGDVIELSNQLRSSMTSLNKVPSMFSLTGDIITEIEALKILTGVSAFQAGAGGIGGAEGGVKLILRGSKDGVAKALSLVEEIHGEPPFVK